MEHRIAHSLNNEQARKVAHKAADSYAARFAQYNPKVDWETEDKANIGFSAKGVSLNGTLALEPGAVVLNLKVPLLLKPFSGKAVGVIDEQVRHWIGAAERGEI